MCVCVSLRMRECESARVSVCRSKWNEKFESKQLLSCYLKVKKVQFGPVTNSFTLIAKVPCCICQFILQNKLLIIDLHRLWKDCKKLFPLVVASRMTFIVSAQLIAVPKIGQFERYWSITWYEEITTYLYIYDLTVATATLLIRGKWQKWNSEPFRCIRR